MTDNRIVIVGTDGLLEDDAKLTWNGSILTVTGNVSVSNTIGITGAATFSNNVVISDLTDNRLVVVGTSGILEDDTNLTWDGSILTVTGNVSVSNGVTFSNTFDVTGAVTLANTLDVTGELTLSNNVIISDLTDNRIVIVGTNGLLEDDASLTWDGSILTVTGNVSVSNGATFANTMGVIGAVALANTLGATGAVTFANTMGVIGAVALANTLGATGAVTFANTLEVTGESTFNSNVNVTGSANVSQAIYVGANVSFTTDTIALGDVSVNTTIISNNITTNTAVFHDRVSVGNILTNTVITSSQLQVNSIFVANTTKVEANSLLIGLKGLDVSGTSDLAQIIEKANLVSAAPTSPLTNIDVLSGSVVFYLNAMTANIGLNFRGNASTSLNNLLSVGDSITVAVIVLNGATSYYPTAYTIDTGVSVAPKWQGGLTPTSGTSSAYDIYTYTIMKYNAAPLYHVFATQSFFL